MVNYIITSSILILLVVLLRQLLKGKIMLRLQYAMWLLVLVRLLIPVQLGSSPLSIMNVASIIEASANEQTAEDLFTGTNSNVNKNESTVSNTNSNVNKNDNAVTNTKVDTNKSDETVLNDTKPVGVGSQVQMSDSSTKLDITENNIINSNENTNTAIKQNVVNESLNFDISTLILCCWIFGAVILGGILLVSNIIFRYRLICTRKSLKISDYPLAVYISNEVPSSCLFGIFKPAVYLTEEAAANDEQRRFVLEHELTHFKHMDHVWSILRNLLLIMHWYNPMVWVAAVLSRRDAELACDEATISRLGDSVRVEYGKALLELSQIKRRNAYLLSFSAASNKEDLKERINMLVYKPSMKKITAVVLALMLCVITACTFTGKTDGNQADTENQEVNNEQQETEAVSEESNAFTDLTSDMEDTLLWYSKVLPSIDNASKLDDEYLKKFIFNYFTSSDPYTMETIDDVPYNKVPENVVKDTVYEVYGLDMPEYYPDDSTENIFYNEGYYYVAMSDFPEDEYTLDDYEISGDTMNVTFNKDEGYKVFTIEKANNSVGFIVKFVEIK